MNLVFSLYTTLRRRWLVIFLLSGFFFGSFSGINIQALASVPTGFADIVQPLLPAVVNISTTSEVSAERRGFELPDIPPEHPLADLLRRFMEDQLYNRPRTYLGSGFIIDPAGWIVTSNHIIAEADEITVILNNETKTELKAEVVRRDRRTDLALLKVNTPQKLPYVEWGDSNAARVGNWVIAVGNPFGLSSTVTAGIISTIARNIPRAGGGGGADYVRGYIQTDAAINMGNSGGPLFDMNGKVIGVNTAILTPSGGNVGIGFAIPSSIAKPVIEQLKNFGRTRHGWIGVMIQPVGREIAEALKLTKAEGVLVARLTPQSPAAKAGLKPGDVILEFNGKPVKDMQSLTYMVGETKIGTKAPIVIWRNGHKETLNVEVGEFEQAEEEGLLASDSEERAPSPSATQEVFGLIVRPLQNREREELGLPADSKGLLILRVKPGSEVDKMGELRRGEVITHAYNTPVTKPQELLKEAEKAKREGAHYILLQVSRGRESRYAALPIAPSAAPKKQGVKRPREE